MSYLQSPVTPPAQRAPSAASQHSNMKLLTPDGVAKVNQLKRKASDLSDQEAPAKASSFLEWRLSVIKAQIAVLVTMRGDYRSSLTASKTKATQDSLEPAIERLEVEQTSLEREFLMLVKQKPFLREDLQDSSQAIEESYAADIVNSWRLASAEGQKNQKKRALPRKQFRDVVAEYLDSIKSYDPTAPREVFCNVLGYQAKDMVKCAHIIPFCFDSIELSYTFGTDDSALRDPRNGLFLNRVIEGGFDNGWIAIIPNGSVDTTPTEWKLVVLKDSILNDTVYTPGTGGEIIRWRDIDGKQLQFCNNNRPARRYLYFRYVMAHMNAVKEGHANIDKKLPNGRIWASPNKPDGYLRKSVLQVLAQRIGDQPLPFELVEAGTFEDTDPASGRLVEDEKASIELSYRMKENRKGNLKDDDDDDDDEDGDDDEEEVEEGSQGTPTRRR